MPINTTGYTTEGTSWKQRNSASITGQGKQKHSEVQVIGSIKTGRTHPFLIVQDAFPCEQCDTKFISDSGNANGSVVFKITANNGSYSADHGLGLVYNTFPTIIWYHNGAKTIGAVAPAGFPPRPNFDNL